MLMRWEQHGKITTSGFLVGGEEQCVPPAGTQLLLH